MITEQDVYIYREIYYEYFKPALNGRFGMSLKDAERVVKPALEKFGWTYEKYQAFCDIDMMQRFAKMKSKLFIEKGEEPKVEIRTGDEEVSEIAVGAMPELKCPRRTTQID